MKRLAVIAPGLQAGGANLLLARTAEVLARRHGWALTLVDVEGGAAFRYLEDQGAKFHFVAYRAGRVHDIYDADAVLVSLLGAKLIHRRYRLRPTARLLTWCTAPQDPFKFFSLAIGFNRSSWRLRRLIATTLWRSHASRIATFLREGASRGGVVFMDEHNLQINRQIFDCGIPSSLAHLCTAEAAMPPRGALAGPLVAAWIGRVDDFKTECMIAGARAILDAGMASKIIAIGDGADIEVARRRLRGLPVDFLGHLPPAQLDRCIRERASFAFGHATALLEAARNGVPSLLIDACYDPIPKAALRAEWLHNLPPGYVGKICDPSEMVGRAIPTLAGELSAGLEDLALNSHRHWIAHHSPVLIGARINEVLIRGDYTLEDFENSGAASPGPIGRAIDWLKESLFRRIY